MKNTRRIITAVLALTMATVSFSACTNEKASEKTSGGKSADVEVEANEEMNKLQQDASDEYEEYLEESQAAADSRAAEQAAEEEAAQQDENYEYYESLNEEYEKYKDTLFNQNNPTLTDGKVAYFYDDNNQYYIFDLASKKSSSIQPPTDDCGVWRYYDGYIYCECYSTGLVYKMDESGKVLKQIAFPKDDWDVGQCLDIYVTPENGVVIHTSVGYYLIDPDFTSCTALPTLEVAADHGLTDEVGIDNIVGATGNTLYVMADYNFFAIDLNSMSAEQILTEAMSGRNVVNEKYYRVIGKYLLAGSYIFDIEADEFVGFSERIALYYHGGTYTTEDNWIYRTLTRKECVLSQDKVSTETKEEGTVYTCNKIDSGNYTVLNDTYLIYEDDYGIFLYNYVNGEEETVAFKNS